jgi:hypothetical protein
MYKLARRGDAVAVRTRAASGRAQLRAGEQARVWGVGMRAERGARAGSVATRQQRLSVAKHTDSTLRRTSDPSRHQLGLGLEKPLHTS